MRLIRIRRLMKAGMRPRHVAVIGLGYVGLPVAAAFGHVGQSVLGFDTNARRISELSQGIDRTGEVAGADLFAKTLRFTTDPQDLRWADFFIVTVPTPIDASNTPDLEPLRDRKSTRLNSSHLVISYAVFCLK